MAITRQVTCINKSNRSSRHEAISYIGGSWGKVSQHEAIKQIVAREYHYYVSVNGQTANVIVETRSGIPYLKTDRDSTTVDNLLSLKECY